MSRKQFLVELSQYLTFVSPEQRDEIISYYDAMLENAGLKGEAALLQEIGTPMAVAIALKRRLEANEPLIPDISDKIDTPYFVKYRRYEVKKADISRKSEGQKQAPGSAKETPTVSKVATTPEETSEVEAQEENNTESEATAQVEDIVQPENIVESGAEVQTEEAVESKAEAQAEETVEPKTEAQTEDTVEPESEAQTEDDVEPKAESQTEETTDSEVTAPAEDAAESEDAVEFEDMPESESDNEESAPATETADAPIDNVEAPVKPPLTFGRVMTGIGIAIASVVIVAFFALIAAVGGVIISSAVDVIISGFDSVSYLSDKLMIFGGGALIMALGILLAWFAIWAAIRLIIGMIRSFNRTAAPEKSILKTFWKVAWIILLILASIAVICGGVSLCLGGDLTILGSNEAFSRMLSRLTPMAFWDFFKSLGLFG